jgi:hypothetical protein
MAKFFGLGSKTPVKIAFQIHVQEIKPWMSMTTMTMQGGISSTPAIILSWTQGEKRSGSTKPIQPLNGKIIFNEEFKLSVTMLEKTGKQKREWESKYLLFTLHDLSLPSQSSSTQLNSRTLASAELDLSKVINLEERMITFTIPLNVRGGGSSSQGSSNNPSAAAAPILSLRISAQVVKAVALFNSSMIKGTWRPSSSSASTNVKTNVQARNNNANSIEDLEIDSFTDDDDDDDNDDDDDSPRSSTGSTKEVENKAELNRKKLFESQSPVPKSNSNSGKKQQLINNGGQTVISTTNSTKSDSIRKKLLLNDTRGIKVASSHNEEISQIASPRNSVLYSKVLCFTLLLPPKLLL